MSSRLRLFLSIAVPMVLAAAPRSAHAEVFEVGPNDDFEGQINMLQPGDELILQGGEYTLTERFSFALVGTADMPIVIRAKDGEVPHFHRPNADQNIVDIDNAEYVELRGIEFSGGSAGVRISAARFLTIDGCEIHDSGDVALRANDGGTYENLHIVNNHIHHTNNTGEGMYLGCNNDGCRLANSIIEHNWVHHTNQASVEQGDGIELKEGSHGNVIRDNVIHDTNYPCILTYSAAGNGEPNIIERNVLWNCGDHGIQSAADSTIRNNIILSSNADGIAMQSHQSGSPSNQMVVHNTVLHATNDAISLRDASGSVVIANNAVYAQQGNAIYVGGGNLGGVTIVANVGVGGIQGFNGGFSAGDLATDFIDAHYGGAPPIDVFPAVGSALVGAGDPAYVADDDFNTTPRNGEADVGAYKFDPDGNPGWPLGEGFKGDPPSGGTDSGGTDGTGGSGDGSGDGTAEGGDATADGGSNDGSGDGSGGQDDDGGGCGCRSSQPPSWLVLFGILGLGLRRRP